MVNVVISRSQSVLISESTESGEPMSVEPALSNPFIFLNAKNRKKTAHQLFTLLMVFALLFATVPLHLVAADSSPDSLDSDSDGIDDPVNPSSSQKGTGSISGFLWVDTDWDGYHGSGELSLSGYPVYLYLADDLSKQDRPQPVAQTKTAKNGTYTFNDLEPGTYVAGLISSFIGGKEYLLPMAMTGDNKFGPDWGSSPIMAFTDNLTVTAGGSVENVNAGMRLPMGIMQTNNIIPDEIIDLSTTTSGTAGYTVSGGISAYSGGGAVTGDRVLTITNNGIYEIVQSGIRSSPPDLNRPKENTSIFKNIVIPTGLTVTLIIDDIDLVGDIELQGNANVTLLVRNSGEYHGANVCDANYISGSIIVPWEGIYSGKEPASILIDSADDPGSDVGYLHVTANIGNAAIGGVSGHANASLGVVGGSGDITINGSTVYARGGDGQSADNTKGGSGIGSAGGLSYALHPFNNIIINGGNVTAIGGSNPYDGLGGAGIGGGYDYFSTIEINGGYVDATAGPGMPGIGNTGLEGATCDITIRGTISDETIVFARGGINGAGIGGRMAPANVTI